MIQEYLALGIFIIALGFALASLIKFVINQIKKPDKTQCGGQCSCNTVKNISPGPVSVKSNFNRSSRLRQRSS